MLSLICDYKYSPRSVPLSILAEAHTVEASVPYSVNLKEKPSKDYDIIISGYTESTSSPTSDNEFYVDYDKAVIYFYYGQAGESISISYYGIGSPIVSDDVNRFTYLLNSFRVSVYSFLVEAAGGGTVRMYGGEFISGTTIITKKELLIDFSLNGNFAVSISDGYYRKVILGADTSTDNIAKVEGNEALKYYGTKLPLYSSDFKPSAVVTIGSDYNISPQDIISVRNFLV